MILISEQLNRLARESLRKALLKIDGDLRPTRSLQKSAHLVGGHFQLFCAIDRVFQINVVPVSFALIAQSGHVQAINLLPYLRGEQRRVEAMVLTQCLTEASGGIRKIRVIQRQKMLRQMVAPHPASHFAIAGGGKVHHRKRGEEVELRERRIAPRDEVSEVIGFLERRAAIFAQPLAEFTVAGIFFQQTAKPLDAERRHRHSGAEERINESRRRGQHRPAFSGGRLRGVAQMRRPGEFADRTRAGELLGD
ncbi:MAG: hypothetical protein HONDAALG_04318 [Gammaproteobacteria bacterium]|nr:hypothetical protein [Gammaproteobacteria bacterium]